MSNLNISLASASAYFDQESEIYKKDITLLIEGNEILISSHFSNFKVTNSVSFLHEFKLLRDSQVETIRNRTFVYLENTLNPYIKYISNLNLGPEKVSDKELFLNELVDTRDKLSKSLMTYDLKFRYYIFGKCNNVIVDEERDFNENQGPMVTKFWAHVTNIKNLSQEILETQKKDLSIDGFLSMKKNADDYQEKIYQARTLSTMIKKSKEEGHAQVPKILSMRLKWRCAVNSVPIKIDEPLTCDMQAFEAKVRKFTAITNAPATPILSPPVPLPKFPQPYFKQGLPPVYPVILD